MRKAVIPSGLIGLALLALTSGCGTIEFFRRVEHKPHTSSPDDVQVTRQSEALAQYSLGLIAQDSGDGEAAVRHFQAAVENDPDNPELKMDLAVGLLHQGRYDELDTLLGELEQTNPDLIKVYQLKVLSLRIRGLNMEALEPLSKAIAIDPGEPMHYIESASIYLREGNTGEAFNVLDQSLDIVTNRQPVYHALGELYLRQAGDIVAADALEQLPQYPLEKMKEATGEYPEDSYILNQYGDLLILHRQIEEAINVFTAIEKLQPDNLQLRQKLALSLMSIGDRDRAIEMLEDIAVKRPANSRVWYYLAELNESSGNIDRAVECLDEIISINPESPDAYLRKAYILLSNKMPKKAQETLEAGAESNPDDPRITEMLAYVYMANLDYSNAIVSFERVERELADYEQAPLLSNFYLNYAVAYQMIGDNGKAADILRNVWEGGNTAILDSFLQLTLQNRYDRKRLTTTLNVMELLQDIIPDQDSTYTLYALIAFNAEMHEQAITLFEKAEQLAIASDDEEALTAQFYFWMGASSERLKQYDKAEEYFLDAISIQPDYAEAHNYLAYMHAERGVKLETALDHVGVALAVDPDNPAFLDTRGWIYYQQGRFEDALIDTEAAAKEMPDDPTISDHMGDIYKALGDDRKAAAWWTKSYDEDGTNEAVLEKIKAYEATRDDAPEIKRTSPLTPSE